MSNLGSPLGTTQPFIPVVPPTQIGRYAGLHMHFPILTDGAGDPVGSTSLLSAVLQERSNITLNGTGIWAANQSFTVATEPVGVKRLWVVGASASLSHAKTVTLRAGLVVLLANDTNAVLATSGAPTGGNAGDLAVDFNGNAFYVNTAGTWGAAQALGSGGGGAVAALTVTSAVIPNAAPNTVVVGISRAYFGLALPAPTAFVATVDGTARTSTAIVATDATHATVTFNGAAALANGSDLLAYTEGATRLVSLDGSSALNSFSGFAITDSVAPAAAPTSPTVAAGTNTATAVSGTIAAGTGTTPTSYIISYKKHTDPTYTVGPTVAYTGVNTPFTIPGLTPSTSYDVTAVAAAAGSAGNSPASAVMTSSTSAAVGSISAAVHTLVATENLTTDGGRDYFIIGGTPGQYLFANGQIRKFASGSAVGLLTVPTLVNATSADSAALADNVSGPYGLTVTDSNFGTVSNMTTTHPLVPVSTTSPAGAQFTAPATTTPQTVRIWSIVASGGSAEAGSVIVTLSDGSAAQFTYTAPPTPTGYKNGEYAVDITFNAASIGQTATFQVLAPAGYNCGIHGVMLI